MLLDELIARQRFILNRTVRITRRQPSTTSSSPADTIQLADSEQMLADFTDLLAGILEQRANSRFEFLRQAHTQMLTAVSSLRAADAPNSVAPEKAALTSLIKARDRVRQWLKKCDPSAGQAMRQFDRLQAQKLRRPKDDGDLAGELASQLRQAARQEERIQEDLQQLAGGDANVDQQEVAENQRAVAADVAGIGRAVRTADGTSDLARRRMGQATQQVADVSDAISQDEIEDAVDKAKAAVSMLDELARHVEGLLERDVADKIAAARDLSDFAAARQRQMGGELPSPGSTPGQAAQPSAESSSKGNSAGAGNGDGAGGQSTSESRAAQQVQTGRTLEDLLRSLTLPDEAGTSEATQNVARILEEGHMDRAMQQIQRFSELVKRGSMSQAQARSQDIVDLLDSMAQRLDGLHRSMVSPRAESMLALEQRATELLERLKQLRSGAEITQWHHDATKLVEQLWTLGAARASTQQLQETMSAEGWGPNGQGDGWAWSWEGPYYGAPDGYVGSTRTLVDELQLQVRELLLKDMVASDDEAIPPQYEELVERYYQVLSQGVEQRR